MMPSAIAARSSAAQAMLFGASRAQRSPLRSPAAARNARAAAMRSQQILRRGGDVAAGPQLFEHDCAAGAAPAFENVFEEIHVLG